MSLPKAQLVDPQGNMNLPGMTATGIVTATSLSGIATGSATGLTGNPDLDVGIVTASSFVGQGDGHAANLTGTPQLSLGIATATSFVGDATGKAAGLTGTPNLNVGLITATSFVGFVTGDVTGNISGLAASITPGVNLGVGVCTAIQYHGDGSALTGTGSSAYIAQEITATTPETIIDLSYGNLIYYKGQLDTTVGFASTSAAEQITFVRDTNANYDISYSTGGVDFDGSGDYLSVPNSSDYSFGSGDFTVEGWFNLDSTTSAAQTIISVWDYDNAQRSWQIEAASNGTISLSVSPDGTNSTTAGGANITANAGKWTHFAGIREGNTLKLYINGTLKTSASYSGSIYDNTDDNLFIGILNGSANPVNGQISNIRVVKGTAVYTENFVPPSAALTNITNTKLLCCQSDSSTTTAAVIATGSITAGGDPTAGAETISLTGPNASITWPSTVKWNNNTGPTLLNSSFPSSFQIFRLTTVDTGLNYNAWEEMEEDSDKHIMFGTNKIATRWLNGAVSKYSSPVQVEGNNFRSIFGDSGSETIYAFKTDGTLWGGGNGDYGVLAQNSETFRSSPIQITTATNWNYGSTNGYTVGATKTDGTLWVWGYNATGQLGQDNTTHRSSPVQVPGTTWNELGSGIAGDVQAFKTDGTLWVWGQNNHGQLGQNNTTLRSSPVQIPGTTWNIGANASGGRNQAAIKTDGSLWIWGTNENGQLGQNTNGTPSGTLDGRSSPAQVGTDTTWANIVWTQYTAYAVKTDGSLWQWGQDLYATNNTVHRSSPTQIPGTWSVNLSASRYTAGCVKTDGTLWAWGRAYNGIFGQNLDQDGGLYYSSPIQIPGTWSTQKNRLCVSNDVVTVLRED